MAGAATMLVGTVRLSLQLHMAPSFANLDYVGHPDQFHNTGTTLRRPYRHWDRENCFYPGAFGDAEVCADRETGSTLLQYRYTRVRRAVG